MLQISELSEVVWRYYNDHGRSLLWRQPGVDGKFDPYPILVSEIMLQQTQVTRVTQKYQEFLQEFPTVASLASARLGDVLRLWSGLGYNRRAKFLWQAAQKVVSEYGGVFPSEQKELTKLPGVGINTAGAICAYAFNQPVVFIETNVRTVYIHHFFHDQDDVSDKELMPLVADSVDKEHPREWYWALMDYGSHLKKTVGNVSRSSKHYGKQSTFQGSRRQVRGKIVQLLTQGPLAVAELLDRLDDQRSQSVIQDLEQEGLVVLESGVLRLA